MYLKLEVIGHIGQDAVSNTVNGKQVLNFSVAHTEKFKDAQGNARENTTWVKCSVWDKPNLQPWLKKGQLVLLIGKPEVRPYTTNTGELRAELRLRVHELKLLGSNREQQGAAPAYTPQVTQQESQAVATAFNDSDLADDLPF